MSRARALTPEVGLRRCEGQGPTVDLDLSPDERHRRVVAHQKELYKKVELEWAMCLAPLALPESAKEVYRELSRSHTALVNGWDTSYSAFILQAYSLLEVIYRVNDLVVDHNRERTGMFGWYREPFACGHIGIFGDMHSIYRLKLLESRVVQIPGVMRTRVYEASTGKRPCLIIFVSLDIQSEFRRKIMEMVDTYMVVRNSKAFQAVALAIDLARYDNIELESVVTTVRLQVDTARYDQLDPGVSTACYEMFQLLGCECVLTIGRRLKAVVKHRKAVLHWIKTGEFDVSA